MNQGARIILDGRKLKIKRYPKGVFMGSTILDNVDFRKKIFDFGRFSHITIAIRRKFEDQSARLST